MTIKKPLFFVICIYILLLLLTFKGTVGNYFLPNTTWKQNSGLESSHERSSYAIMQSLLTTGTVEISGDHSSFLFPDIGKYGTKFYSLFPPGIALIMLIPFVIGSIFNVGQIFAYLPFILIALINFYLIYFIAFKIFGTKKTTALITSLIYSCSSIAWGYSLTPYQHSVTTLCILLLFIVIIRFCNNPSHKYLSLLIIIAAFSYFIDYINIILILPFWFFIFYSRVQNIFTFANICKKVVYISVIILLSLCPILMYNHAVFGNLQVTHNALLRLNGPNIFTNVEDSITKAKTTNAKDRYFSLTYIPNGIKVLFFSSERGLFFYSPIFLLSLVSVGYLWYKKKLTLNLYLLLSLILVNILLYCSFRYPEGGLTFGPRYLISALPFWSILIAVFIESKKNTVLKITFFALFIFSSAISLSGALTTNLLQNLRETQSVSQKDCNYKCTFVYNFKQLSNDKSGSLVYNHLLKPIYIPLYLYYGFILVILYLLMYHLLFIRED